MDPRHQELRSLYEQGVLTPEQEDELRRYEDRSAYEQIVQGLNSGELQLTPTQQLNFDRMNPADFEPSISPMGAAGRGAIQELTLGTADEIAGGVGSLFSDQSAGTEIGRFRANDKLAELSHPGHYFGGQIAGALGSAVVPTGLYMRGAGRAAGIGKALAAGAQLGTGIGGTGLGRALASSMLLGAGTEAIRGFASEEGGFGNRASGAGIGATIGAGGGAIGTVAGRGIGKAVRAARGRIMGPKPKGMSERAFSRVMNAFNRDAAANESDSAVDSVRQRIADLGAHSKGLEDQIMLADVPGDLHATAAVAARAAGASRPDLTRTLDARAEQLEPRMREVFDRHIGSPTEAHATEMGLEARRKDLSQQYDNLAQATGELDATPIAHALRAGQTGQRHGFITGSYPERLYRSLMKSRVQLTPDEKDVLEKLKNEFPTLTADIKNMQSYTPDLRRSLQEAEARAHVQSVRASMAPGTVAEEVASDAPLESMVPSGIDPQIMATVRNVADDAKMPQEVLFSDPGVREAITIYEVAKEGLETIPEDMLGDQNFVNSVKRGVFEAQSNVREAAVKAADGTAAARTVDDAADGFVSTGDETLDDALQELQAREATRPEYGPNFSNVLPSQRDSVRRQMTAISQIKNAADPHEAERIANTEVDRILSEIDDLSDQISHAQSRALDSAVDMTGLDQQSKQVRIHAETLLNHRSDLSEIAAELTAKDKTQSAGQIRGIIDTIDGYLDEWIPGYGDLRADYADVMNRGDIIDEGRAALAGGDKRLSPAALTARVAELNKTPEDGLKNLFRMGLREAIDKRGGLLQKGEHGVSSELQRAWNRHLLGEVAPDAPGAIDAAMKSENVMHNTHKHLGAALAAARKDVATDEIAPRRDAHSTLLGLGVGGFNRALDLLRLTPRRRALNETAGRFDNRPALSLGPVSKGTAASALRYLSKNDVAEQVLDFMTSTGRNRDQALEAVAKRVGFDNKGDLIAWFLSEATSHAGRSGAAVSQAGALQ